MIRSAIRGNDPLVALPTLIGALPVDQRVAFAPLLDASWSPTLHHVTNGSVWGCLAEAVWALRSTTSFEAAVVAAIGLGGDTDTVACVTGALAGARYGIQAIPSRWIPALNWREMAPAEPVRSRATTARSPGSS